MLDSVVEFFRNAVAEQIVADPLWAIVALVGQVIFGGRFVVQWIASERRKQSYVPPAFWVMSVVGSLTMLAYAVHLENPILMAAFSLNVLIYLRNLQMIYRRTPSVTTAANPA